MNGIVDFHSHVLPGVDDGSASVKESLAMLQMEADHGIHRVIATPHFYPQTDSPERFLARRHAAESRLKEAMTEQGNLPEIICGAEVYFFHGISDCDALPELTIGKNRYVLVEMPMIPWTQKMYAELEEIHAKRGITPIIAHVDRYLGMFNDHGIPKRLQDLPVLVQANASFFLRSGSRGKALRMLKRDQIHLLGSDCHSIKSRPPKLDEALKIIEKNLPNDILERIVQYQDQVLAEL